MKLPQNHRQIVYPNGTLIIKKIERAVDEDFYTCIVNSPLPSPPLSSSSSPKSSSGNHQSSSSSSSSSSTVFIKVMIAPLISPFSAAPNLREGMRSILTCSVLEGDPPFSFRWTKDDQPIDTQFMTSDFITSGGENRLKVTSSNDFSSTLFISKISYEDNGNFTCIVTNPAASTNYTVNHLVKGESTWIVSRHDIQNV